MENTIVPSIYNIFCHSNGKSYIGSAVNPRRRYGEHISRLRQGKHENSYLQNAWNKYGESDFSFVIIEEVGGKERLIDREQYWMDMYDSYNREFGFNLCPVAGSTAGFVHSETTRKKIGAAIKGNKNALGYKHTAEARKKLSDANKGKILSKKTRRKMSAAHRGKIKSKETCRKLSDAHKGRIKSKDHRKKIAYSKALTWEVMNPMGEAYIIKNLHAFCQENGLGVSSMCRVASGKYNHHKGWKCRKVMG